MMEIGIETGIRKALEERRFKVIFHTLSDGKILEVSKKDSEPMYQKDYDKIAGTLDLWTPS